MSVGPMIRRLFGRYEQPIAALYRACFVNLEDYGRRIRACAPGTPARILEVGCGEGAVTELLARLYPQADILGIDITGRVGRLYRGPRNRVRFRQVTVQEVAEEQPGVFDLVIISDVIHHVPQAMRNDLLGAVRRTLVPGGVLVLKDWERRFSPVHWTCYMSDRWITGDRVNYLRRQEMVTLLAAASFRTADRDIRVRPWRNNFVLLANA